MTGGEDPYPTRSFGAGRASFVVACPSVEIKDVVEELFGDLPDGEAGEAFQLIRLNTSAEGLLELFIAEGDQVGGQDLDGAMASLVTAVSRLALDADPSRLHLHCAALSLDGMGALVSAASGTGKTTLAAALASRGWAYLTDEAVALSQESSSVSGFPKPLIIKPGGGDLVPHLESARVACGKNTDSFWWHVPVGRLEAAALVTEIEPAAIVILHRSADGSTDAEPVMTNLEPADTVVALMGQTMDSERFGHASLSVLARLAASCRCVGLTVGPLHGSALLLEELVQSPHEPYEVREFEGPADRLSGDWCVSADVASVVIGERAIVHHIGGAIAALDEAGTAVWCALHGSAPAWWPPDTMEAAVTQAFLGELAEHGFLLDRAAEEQQA